MAHIHSPLSDPPGDPLAFLHRLVSERLCEQQLTTIRECADFCDAYASDDGAQIAQRLREEADRLEKG